LGSGLGWRSRNVLYGGPDPSMGRGEFGKGPPVAKYRDIAVSSTKADEPIEMPG